MAASISPTSKFDVVVTIEWQAGSVVRRYGGRTFSPPYAGGDPISVAGRLTRSSQVTLSTDSVTDSVDVTLDNTGSFGDETVESCWSDAHPPEGSAVEVAYLFNDDDWGDRVILLTGQIVELTGVSDLEVTLAVNGVDAALPTQVNTEINLTDYPDAPRESVGLMKQLVFGTVSRMRGIPVTTIAKTTTTTTLTSAATSIPVGDVSQLPSSGTVLVNGTEQVTYTSIVGQDLTGCTRGANSTVAADYGSGVPVVEVGQLDILFAGHDVDDITQVWGVVGAVIQPIDPAAYSKSTSPNAVVSFADGWPKIPVPAGQLQACEIQYDEVDPSVVSGVAINPAYAAGGNPAWLSNNAAEVNSTNSTLALLRAAAFTPPGELVRNWLVCEFDDTPFPLASGSVGLYINGTGPLVALAKGGNVTSALRDLLGLGEIRLWDATHTHGITDPSTATVQLRVDAVTITGGLTVAQDSTYWLTTGGTPLANVKDGNDGTYALSKDRNQLPDNTDLLSVRVTNFGAYTGQAGKTPTRIRARCKYGQTIGSPPYYTDDAYLRLNISGSRKTQNRMVGAQGSYGVQNDGDWWPTTSWTDVANAQVEVAHIRSVDGSGNYVLWGQNITEIWLEVEYNTATTNTNAVVAPIVYSTAMVYDLGAATWADLTSAQIGVGSSSPTNVKIIRAYILAEYSPYVQTPCEKILGDVQGMASGGLPTDVLLGALDVCGLHLKRNATDFSAAAAIFSASSVNYRQDFAQYDPISGAALLRMICEEARLRYFWEEGLLCVVYLPALASLPSPASRWADVSTRDSVTKMTRTPIAKVFTKLNATYKYDGFIDGDAKALVQSVTVPLSTRRETASFATIADGNSAQLLATSRVERAATPRYRMTVMLWLPALVVRRGQIIQVTAGRRTYTKAEVMQVVIQDQYVTLSLAIWDTV